jgi:hypothetical protein
MTHPRELQLVRVVCFYSQIHCVRQFVQLLRCHCQPLRKKQNGPVSHQGTPGRRGSTLISAAKAAHVVANETNRAPLLAPRGAFAGGLAGGVRRSLWRRLSQLMKRLAEPVDSTTRPGRGRYKVFDSDRRIGIAQPCCQLMEIRYLPSEGLEGPWECGEESVRKTSAPAMTRAATPAPAHVP